MSCDGKARLESSSAVSVTSLLAGTRYLAKQPIERKFVLAPSELTVRSIMVGKAKLCWQP